MWLEARLICVGVGAARCVIQGGFSRATRARVEGGGRAERRKSDEDGGDNGTRPIRLGIRE